MTPNEQKKAAKEFVARWKAAEGNEQRESNSFWIELCMNVLGIANPTQHLDFERKVKGRRIDVFYEDMGILIENKSRGISLDLPEQRGKDRHGNPRMVTPFEQAKWYADNITPKSVTPKWIITCNFDEIRIHDMDREDAEESYETLTLDELPDFVHRLSFFTRKENSRLEREKQLSVKAGEVVGKLYDTFAKAYRDIENSAEEQRSLNILITRIVFLLYAEDAELLHERNAFYNYLKNFQVAHMRQALIDLFNVLRTPDGTGDTSDERDPYLSAELAAFPYVNGGLFADDIIIPQFDIDTRFILLQEASAEFDWSHISPTIFGAVFESTLNPETRRAGGMHYTSIENIHKVTGPLFYDALKDELTAIEGLKTEKERKFKLQAFRTKLASLKFLDPACGSGNFLTETYLSLRKLENRVLEDLYGGQMVMGAFEPIQVTLDQFFGIEINDFAVEVAKTALWIAELQMLDETRQILSMWIDPLPLKTNGNIHEGNALRMDWSDVLPASECSYIIGNPPFVGSMSKTQSDELHAITGTRSLDYVSGWYVLASRYIGDSAIRAAFVSTNSICQGQQVELLWKPLFDCGLHIDFAYQTFVWNSEAIDQAHVHVVIIGFSRSSGIKKILFIGDELHPARNINGYLQDAPNFFIARRSQPLCDVEPMVRGCQPTDGGNLVFSTKEADELVARDQRISEWIRPFSMGADFVDGKPRACIWLQNVNQADFMAVPTVAERVDRVRAMRLESSKAATRKKAETPWLFDEIRLPNTSRFLACPTVTSGKRKYIPLGLVDNELIPGNKLYFISDDSLYTFGVLSSLFHNTWTRVVAGRLKSDYNYSNTVVYNNFVWPQPTMEQRTKIEQCAQAVLDARAAHESRSLAQMYDGISPLPEGVSQSEAKKFDQREFDDLRTAHDALDSAVEAAYGVDFHGDEEKIVAHLFKLYAKKTGGE